MNWQGCSPITRPIITRTKMSIVKNQHFEKLFSDRENIAMSSYKVDPKTNLPILYLKDQKEALWHKFSEIYPDGMKRTSFMARLANGPFRYREDLGVYVLYVVIMIIKYLKICARLLMYIYQIKMFR